MRKTGKTTMPISYAALNPVIASGNQLGTWKRKPSTSSRKRVSVDATRTTIPANETTTLSCNGQAGASARVVALAKCYHFALTQAQIDAMKQIDFNIRNLAQRAAWRLRRIRRDARNQEGDFCLVWAIFWWRDRPDTGDLAAHRPFEVKGVWRNYLMAESYSMDTPKEADTTARIAYNPWPESGFSNGTKSNCP